MIKNQNNILNGIKCINGNHSINSSNNNKLVMLSEYNGVNVQNKLGIGKKRP